MSVAQDEEEQIVADEDAEFGLMNRMMREVAELHRAGRHDEARQLEESTQSAVGKKSQRDDEEQLIQPFEGGRKTPAAEERRGDVLPKRQVSPRVRILHLRQAAEHLQAAGFPEMADKTRKEIARIEQHLRRDAKTVPDAALREEIDKLRREVEELRLQLRRLQTPEPQAAEGAHH